MQNEALPTEPTITEEDIASFLDSQINLGKDAHLKE